MNNPFVVDINQRFALRISLLEENRALPFSTDILGAFAFGWTGEVEQNLTLEKFFDI